MPAQLPPNRRKDYLNVRVEPVIKRALQAAATKDRRSLSQYVALQLEAVAKGDQSAEGFPTSTQV